MAWGPAYVDPCRSLLEGVDGFLVLLGACGGLLAVTGGAVQPLEALCRLDALPGDGLQGGVVACDVA